jgi:hypothetical protein
MNWKDRKRIQKSWEITITNNLATSFTFFFFEKYFPGTIIWICWFSKYKNIFLHCECDTFYIYIYEKKKGNRFPVVCCSTNWRTKESSPREESCLKRFLSYAAETVVFWINFQKLFTHTLVVHRLYRWLSYVCNHSSSNVDTNISIPI